MKKTKIEKQPLPEGTHSAPSSDGDNIKNSLRRKIFRMNILLVAAAVILFAIAGILQMNRFARLMEDTSLEENTVIMETQKGYVLHDRVVRPSQVIVSCEAPKE